MASHAITTIPSDISRYSHDKFPARDCNFPISGVYEIRHDPSGRSYIGSSDHIVRRWQAHRSQLNRGIHHSKYLQNVWNKGRDGFSFAIIEIIGRPQILASEQRWIDAIKPEFNTAVCVENGMKGRRHSEESKRKMSLSTMGQSHTPRVISDETRKKMSISASREKLWLRGKKMKDSQRRLLSIIAKERMADPSRHPSRKMTEINGKVYQNMNLAAKGVGVGRNLMRQLVDRGYARFTEIDIPAGGLKAWTGVSFPSGGDHYKSRSVLLDGIEFPCIRDASTHAGVKSSTMDYWIRKGRASYADGLPPNPTKRFPV
jgi:group I intron endonuclease